MLFETALTHFITSKKAAGKSPRTIENYHYFMSKITFDGRQIESINRFEVDALVAGWQETDWSQSTKRTYTTFLKVFFKWCTDYEIITKDPASHISPPKAVAREKVMTVDTFNKLLAAAAGDHRNMAMLMFMGDTGVRIGELVTLTLERLDIDNYTAIVEGKSGVGEVDFTRTTAHALTAWLAHRPAVSHEFVFTSKKAPYGELSVKTIWKILSRYAKKLNIEDEAWNPHSIRDLVGQRFVDMGNLELARQKLRHSDVSITARYYANQDKERLKAATNKFSLVGGE